MAFRNLTEQLRSSASLLSLPEKSIKKHEMVVAAGILGYTICFLCTDHSCCFQGSPDVEQYGDKHVESHFPQFWLSGCSHMVADAHKDEKIKNLAKFAIDEHNYRNEDAPRYNL